MGGKHRNYRNIKRKQSTLVLMCNQFILLQVNSKRHIDIKVNKLVVKNRAHRSFSRCNHFFLLRHDQAQNTHLASS